MKKTSKILITVKGGGLSYRKEIDRATAGQVLALCLSSQESLEKFGESIAPGSNRTRESVAEYMNRHAPSRNPDKILTLAGHLRDSQGKDSFNSNEIKSLFRDAAEVLPANFSRDFRWVVKNGWIAKDLKKKGNYYITNTGFRVLRGGFSEELLKKSKSKFGGRHKKRTNRG